MSDQIDPPEDAFPRGADDVDPAALAAVQRALGDLAFLRPAPDSASADATADATDEAGPMPEWAWARISAALAAEQPVATRRPSRLLRWGGGLVAASVAVLAVGVGVTAFQGSGDSGDVAVVAGDAADATAFEAAEPVAQELAASRQLTFASMVPPVFRLVDSDTDYTAAGLKDQVEDVMTSNGMPASANAVEEALAAEPEPMVMSDVPADGFTESAQSLRDCVTKLTQQEGSTALLVDRSTFEGAEAGVIVTPESVSAAPTAPAEELAVTVVDPDCDLIMKVWIRLTR